MHLFIDRLAKFMALLGGLTLISLIILTCVSVAGRGANTFAHSGQLPALGQWLLSVNAGPVNGDFELVEAGIAFAIFAFLPLAQLRGAHATVDVFTSFLPERANQFLRLFWEILLTVIIILICWRLFAGMQDKLRYAETTYLIQFPVWWAYAASFAASAMAALVAVYCAWQRLSHFINRQADQRPEGMTR
jgi:heme exporter protein D